MKNNIRLIFNIEKGDVLMKLRKKSFKSVISMLLVSVMILGMLPTINVFAVQSG